MKEGTKMVDYGCFVRIEDGVELIHNSELDWKNKNIRPEILSTLKIKSR